MWDKQVLDISTVKIGELDYFYLSDLLPYATLSRQAILYRIKKEVGSIASFVKRISYKTSNNKTRSRILILASSVSLLDEFSVSKPSKEDIKRYSDAYYSYIELVEDILEKEGASIATECQKWLNMPLIDVDIVAEAFTLYKEENNGALTEEVKKLIRNGVYSHAFSSLGIYNICFSAVESMKNSINNKD